jgi:hypothetical protein
MARFKITPITLVLAEALLVGLGLSTLESCAEAKAVSVAPGLVDQVHLGFGLDREGRVTPGCVASTYSLNDPIHLSMQVADAGVGSVVRVSIRNVVTQTLAWSEVRPVTPGRSSLTFAIGRKLAVGRYRMETTLGGVAAGARDFVVHERRKGVR